MSPATQPHNTKLHFTKHRGAIKSGIIKNIMEIEGDGLPTSLRLYPRNTPEILINLADPILGRIQNRRITAEGTTIQGSKKTYVEAEHPPSCDFISIRFTPNGIYKLFGIPQTEFTNHLYQLGDIMDDPIHLIDTLKNTTITRERIQHINQWLQLHISQMEVPMNLLSDFIIHHLSRDPSLTVKKLVEKTGYTRKHLAQRFKKETGLTIKKFQKIQRVYRILKQVNDVPQPPWARLACHHGYFDQSHFIRDFKRFTGLTPTEYTRLEISENKIKS